MLNVICRRWWILLLRGLCAIALGILAIAMPDITLVALVWVFGAFTMADGVAGVALGIRGEPDGTVWWTMVWLGALAILAGLTVGVMALAWPAMTLLVLAIVIGASAVARGVFEIVAAISLRKLIDDEWVLGLSGLLSILFGVLILARPGTVAVVGILIGAFMLTIGILAVVLSLRLRKVQHNLAAHT
jgi:uncharacterized membrane protein HdeD (DUF308 family)